MVTGRTKAPVCMCMMLTCGHMSGIVLIPMICLLRISCIVFTRNSVCAIARICHGNSVCPSVRLSICLTRMICIKMTERIIKILSLSDRPISLVFRHQGSLRKSGGFTPMGAPNTRDSDYRPICGYISEMVIDGGTFRRRI